MGATRDLAMTEMPMRGISINPESGGSAAITVVPSDSGLVFVNKYTTNTVYTLPTATLCKGKYFWFFNAQATATIALTGGTADVMIGADDTAADTITDNNAIGNWAFVIGDGTNFYVITGVGTWSASG